MLFDCFTYFNEVELLELRIKLLEDIVDGFIIADANKTHKGEDKDFSCLEKIRELNLPEDKIQVLHVELPSNKEILDPWVRESAQRDALGVGMRMCPPDSCFFVSDVDEIPKPEFFLKGVESCRANPDHYSRLSMSFLAGRADLRIEQPNIGPLNWVCGTFLLYEHLDKTLTHIRSINGRNIVLGELDAGWHFSWMGDADRRKTKISSFVHCYDDIPNAVAPAYTEEMMEFLETYKAKEGGTDPLGRGDHILKPYSPELLPPELFKLDRVRQYLLPNV